MRALEALAKARLQGAKPEVVLVTLGNTEQPAWWQSDAPVEIVIHDDQPISRIDFRALVRCSVIVIAAKRDDRLRQLVERVRAEATNITVLASADPDDIGHVWSRDAGWRKFGESFMQEAA